MNAATPVMTQTPLGVSSERTTRPRLSVVVPTRNSAVTLGRCLSSIRRQSDSIGAPFPVELIVVDNQSSDETRRIAQIYAHIVEDWGPERSAQRNRGSVLASAPYVLFIDSDMVLTPTVCAEVFAELDRGAGAVIVPEESFGDGFLARCRAMEKRIALGDPRTEAARGFPVDLLKQVGSWNEGLTAAEDWDLTERVAATGRPIGRTRAVVRHDEGRLRLRTTFTKKTYYGRWVGQYLSTPRGASSGPPRRTRLSPLRLLRKPMLLVRRPDLAIGMVMLKVVEAAGIAVGIVGSAREIGRAHV